jgi:hypothetical protein
MGRVTDVANCGAKKKRGGLCGRPAGWGTDHPGTGKCKLHGGRSTGPKDKAKASASQRGNRNARKTGEYSREAEFARDCAAAPVDPTVILQEQAQRTRGRLAFMYRLLLQTEQRLEELAAAGDHTALTALAVVEIARKQEPRTVGEGDKARTELVDVELSEKSRSLLDLWFQQHDAITRVELLLGRTAERLKPKEGGPTGGGIGTLIINNSMPGVDD